MNKEEALEFLRLHQPMPSEFDDDLDSETVDAWDAAREYFTENPCEEAIPLFLGSIGEGYLFGTYQMLDGFFALFEPDVVVPHLVDALSSESSWTRRWAAEYASAVESGRSDLIEALLKLLFDPDEEARTAAVITLKYKFLDGLVNWRDYEATLRSAYAQETDDWNQEQYDEIFAME